MLGSVRLRLRSKKRAVRTVVCRKPKDRARYVGESCGSESADVTMAEYPHVCIVSTDAKDQGLVGS
jgi:hypothetical protein